MGPGQGAGNERLLLTTARFAVEEVESQGTDGRLHRRAVVRHPGAVTILPLVDEQTICLIRNRRAAVGKSLIELPAGTLEPGEAPRQTAERELVEETGYEAAKLQPLGEFYLSPGILDERMHLFVASELTPVGACREPGEEIENLIVTWKQALAWIDGGEIEDAKTIVGLLRYERSCRGEGAGSRGRS